MTTATIPGDIRLLIVHHAHHAWLSDAPERISTCTTSLKPSLNSRISATYGELVNGLKTASWERMFVDTPREYAYALRLTGHERYPEYSYEKMFEKWGCKLFEDRRFRINE